MNQMATGRPPVANSPSKTTIFITRGQEAQSWHEFCSISVIEGNLPKSRAKEGALSLQQILTPSEVAALLRIHVRTVYKLADEGVIPGNRIGRNWRFDRSAILGLVPGKERKRAQGEKSSGRK